MKAPWLVAIALLLSTTARAADTVVRSSYDLESLPLTTQQVWSVDPEEPNPAFARWALERILQIQDLKAKRFKTTDAKEDYGVDWSYLKADARGYVRGEGPPFFPESRFTCAKEPDSWFATREGSLRALGVAQELWFGFVKERKSRLFLALEHIRAFEPDGALKTARQTIDTWRREIERDWRATAIKRARQAEWDWYKSQSSYKAGCAAAAKLAPPKLRDLLVPSTLLGLKARATAEPEPRLPARLWDGIYSVRAALTLEGARANGRFLVDSLAPKSVIAPSFLASQGFLPQLFEIPGAPLQRVEWSGEGSGGLARLGHINEVDASGVTVPVRDFLLHETTFYEEPAHAAPCCDGIFGMDFLRRFTIEFVPTKPSVLKVPGSAAYQPAPVTDYFWSPLWVNEKGEAETPCELGGKPVRVVWDLGGEEAIRSTVSEPATREWELACEGKRVARGKGLAKNARVAKGAALVGMEVLGRTQFVLDLPNGRIWFPNTAGERPLATNRSGLKIEFEFRKGERVAFVKSIAPGSPAAVLSRAGLKLGQAIFQINSRDAIELDSWDIDQILSGRDGDAVVFSWKTASDALKVAPIQLAPLKAPR